MSKRRASAIASLCKLSERERERERNVFIFKIIDITYNINVTLHGYTLIYKKRKEIRNGGKVMCQRVSQL